MLLSEFKVVLQEHVLNLLWEQWCALGVVGYTSGASKTIIDPESLLLATLRFGRYDQRLFDEVLDWLTVNHKLISVQRITKIQESLHLCEPRILAAVCGWIGLHDSTTKWKRLAAVDLQENIVNESFFMQKNGSQQWSPQKEDSHFLSYGYSRNPVEIRNMSSIPKPTGAATSLLQFRSLFGVNTRAEIMLLLLAHESQSIQEIADKTFYSWHAVQSILQDMAGSGLLIHGGAKRSRRYSLVRESWQPILLFPIESLRWQEWGRYFGIAARLWEMLSDESVQKASATVQAVRTRNWVTEGMRDDFDKAGLITLVHHVELAPAEDVVNVLWHGLSR